MPIAPAQGTPPARRQAPRKSAPKVVATVQSQSETRYDGLMGIAQISSAVLIMKGWYADAGAVTLHGPTLARETANLAAQDERIGRAIDYLNSAGPYSGILLAGLQLGMQIAANHGKIDPDAAAGIGVMHPDVLEAKIKSDVEKQRADLMRQAAEAQKQARQAENVLTELHHEPVPPSGGLHAAS